MLPARERGGQGFAEAEDAFESPVGGSEGIEGELETFEAEDGAAVAFDDGGNAIPIGAAEVATDDEAFGFDALHVMWSIHEWRTAWENSEFRTQNSELEKKAAAGEALVYAGGRGGWPLLMPRDSGSGRTRTVMANTTAAVGLPGTLGG